MIEPGDRVIATQGLGGLLWSKAPKGTQGVVLTRSGVIFLRYTVQFDNGETVDNCPDNALAKLK